MLDVPLEPKPKVVQSRETRRDILKVGAAGDAMMPSTVSGAKQACAKAANEATRTLRDSSNARTQSLCIDDQKQSGESGKR